MKNIFMAVIEFYQRFISPVLPNSCRYYPSCSEYSLHEFKFNSFFGAFFATVLRILRCNPLFRGGIDYPLVRLKISHQKAIFKICRSEVKFWFVPCKSGKFYVIKSFKKEK